MLCTRPLVRPLYSKEKLPYEVTRTFPASCWYQIQQSYITDLEESYFLLNHVEHVGNVGSVGFLDFPRHVHPSRRRAAQFRGEDGSQSRLRRSSGRRGEGSLRPGNRDGGTGRRKTTCGVYMALYTVPLVAAGWSNSKGYVGIDVQLERCFGNFSRLWTSQFHLFFCCFSDLYFSVHANRTH